MMRGRLKLAALAVVASLVVLGAGVMIVEHVSEPGSDQREVLVADRAAQLAQGAYLAKVGNCMACHTAAGAPAYAGGRPLETPFGTMFAPNLTPDVATGLGQWTSDDFWRALHNGKSRDGSLLYPAFPYPNYTKVTRADSDALYAYLRTLAPVTSQARPHALRFPYNLRPLLAFWRALYFTPGSYQPQASQSQVWNRGAYLVQGLGHCSACHAPRNALGASLGEERLGGGPLPGLGWHAPALGGANDPLELAELLHTGVSERRAVAGPMAHVVGASLQHVHADDVGAMAQYLVSLPGPQAASAAAGPDGAQRDKVLRLGAGLYEKHCLSCHGAGGEGKARAYPQLAGRGQGSSANAVRMLLDGGFAPSTEGNPWPYGMPPFGAVLNDAEAAAVLSYVRSSWGNQGTMVLPQEVGKLRGSAVP